MNQMDLNLSLHDKIPLGSSIVDSCVQKIYKNQRQDQSDKDISFILYHDLSPLCLKNLKKWNLVFWELILSFLPSMKSDQNVFQRNRQSVIISSTIGVIETAWTRENKLFWTNRVIVTYLFDGFAACAQLILW
jgi:hypothetical protein